MKLVLALGILAQSLTNTGPISVTPSGATIQQSFTVGQTVIAALQFQVPAGVAMPTPGALGTKTLLCYAPTRLCIIYGNNDTAIPTSILSQFVVTASGSYALAGVIGASVVGNDVPITVGAPLAVVLPFSKCDINRDGAYSQADQDLLASYLVNPGSIPQGTVTDINGNGNFNNGDVQLLGRVIRGIVQCPE